MALLFVQTGYQLNHLFKVVSFTSLFSVSKLIPQRIVIAASASDISKSKISLKKVFNF